MTNLANQLRLLAFCEEAVNRLDYHPHTVRAILGNSYQMIVGYNPFDEDPEMNPVEVLNILRDHMATTLMAVALDQREKG